MFTGLIETVGRVVEIAPTPSGASLRIRTELAGELRQGESLAVNGVCLTVTQAAGGEVHADIGPETARITTLGSLQRDQRVNLERSMRADGRFGGHFVQGHVDGVGTVEAVRRDGDAHWVTVGFGAALAPYLIPKGSVAVDGVSLTVAALHDDRFEVMLIPYTWEHTALSAMQPGDQVNLECDMLGKYVARAIQASARPQ